MATLRVRPGISLTFACLALYLAAAAQIRHPEGSSLSVAVAALARPAYRATEAMGTALAALREGWRDAAATRAQLRQAQEEIEELRRVNQLLAVEVTALRESDRLLASLPPAVDRVVLARVVARDAVGEHVAIIDRGRRHGIVRDAPVLAAEGVVGRVERVGEEVARVQLLSHPQAAAAARVNGSEQEVLLSGGHWPTITGLPAGTVLAEGTPIFTTGAEGIYPPGLLLAVTRSVTVESVLTPVPIQLAVRPVGVTVVAVLPPPSRGRP
ncbi:MAG: rod shape-determining protein MreC [Acidobacteriota bacterium]